MDELRRAGGRRQLQKAQTRQAIADAALQLFAAQGYEATTVDQIAAAAGVAPRTFSLHFAAKSDPLFLFAAHDEQLERTRSIGAALGHQGLWDVFRATTTVMIESIEARRDFFLLRSRLCRESPPLRATELRLAEEWVELIANEIGAVFGCDPAIDITPSIVAKLFDAVSRSAIELWSLSGGTVSLASTVGDALELLRPSIDALDHHLRSAQRASAPPERESGAGSITR